MNVQFAMRMAAAGVSTSPAYADWTLLTYPMFGAGAPQLDPFAEFTSASQDASGWDVTATWLGTLRDGLTECIVFYADMTSVWADAPVDHTLAIMGDIRYDKAGSTANMGVTVGFGNPAVASAAVAAGLAKRGGAGEDYSVTQRSTAGSAAVITGMARSRLVLIPMPGSAYTRAGVAVSMPRTAAGASLAVASNFLQQNAAADVAVDARISLDFLTAVATAGAASMLDVLPYVKGGTVPFAPWDGGSADWELVPFPGGLPDEDPDARFVSAGPAGDTWEIELDASVAAGNGWQDSVIYLPPLPATLAGRLAGGGVVLVAIEWDYSTTTVNGMTACSGFRWNASAGGRSIGVWFNTATNMIPVIQQRTFLSNGSGSTTYNTGAVGGVIGNAASSGPTNEPTAFALGYSATSPAQGSTSPAQAPSTATAVATPWEFFVDAGLRTAPGGTVTLKYRVYVYAIDLDVAEDAP